MERFLLYKKIKALWFMFVFEQSSSGKPCKKKETMLRIFAKIGVFVKKTHGIKKKALFFGKKDILVRKRPFSGLSH